MPTLFDMKGRVDHAIQCIMHGRTNQRDFDACFEMYDGDEVVSAIIRRAEKNPVIMNAGVRRRLRNGKGQPCASRI